MNTHNETLHFVSNCTLHTFLFVNYTSIDLEGNKMYWLFAEKEYLLFGISTSKSSLLEIQK
jgi:hypothetical protein